ncbi:hypothetical protein, partial [Nonomuraea sp. NPDC003201]
MTISDTVGQIWRTSVLLQSARWTGRHLARLAAPALIASLPPAIVVGGLVNGQFALLSALPGPLVGWTVAMVVAHAVVLPATVLMAAGLMAAGLMAAGLMAAGLMAAGLMLNRSVSPS